eukprot:199428_1
MQCLIILLIGVVTSLSDSPLGLDDLIFYNHGSVHSNDKFKLIDLAANYQEGYMYQDDVLNNNNIKSNSLTWLFKVEPDGNTYSTPSSGMRSSVPFGSMGGGIFEMRGDGRFTDSLIYNNGPGAWPYNNWRKMDLSEMMFAVMPQNNNLKYPKILRTQLETQQELHANLQQYAIDNLQYQGAYPTARLSAYDTDWQSNFNFHVNLTAFSTFKPHDINMSTTPGVLFVMDLINDGDEDISVDLLFNFPDQGIQFDNLASLDVNGWTINKQGDNVTSGNITMSAYSCSSLTSCVKLKSNAATSASLAAIWSTFINGNDNKDDADISNKTQYSLISRDVMVKSKSVISIVYSFSYYFPYRSWDNAFIGQYYSNLYKDSVDVNNFTIRNLQTIVTNTRNWHQLMYNNAYPDYLKDFYVNSPSYLVRTSMYLKDGRWRQLEAFDCDQVEPPHVGYYRKLPYQLFFTELDQNIVSTLYIDHMLYSKGMFGEMGVVSESFGGSGGDPGQLQTLDTPNGGPRGDDNPVFILDIYMNWKWADNGDEFMNASYVPAKKAMYYSMNNSISHGYSLPYKMINTFDEHGVIGDLNSYNSIIYIVSLYAMKEMSNAMNDVPMVSLLNTEVSNAKGNLTKYLWNEGNGNFISFYCANGLYSPNTLQGDTLYGLLWKFVLDVDIEMGDILKNQFISHLRTENKWNYAPYSEYGVIFNVNMTNHSYHCAYGSSDSGKFTDLDKWEDFTLNSGSLYAYLLNDTSTAMSYYKTILDKYAKLYKDQWDYRILSHFYGFNQNDTNKALIGIDLPGSDMAGSPHTLSKHDYNLCWSMCNNTEECMAWTYQPSNAYPGCSSYANKDPYCWLKSSVSQKKSNQCVTSGIKPNKEPLAPSRPGCTSHYDRQLIGYSLILALNQQKYDRRNNYRNLSLHPLIVSSVGDCVPVLIPHSSSLFCKVSDKCYNIRVLFGELRLDELIIYSTKIQWNGNKKSLILMQNQHQTVCY